RTASRIQARRDAADDRRCVVHDGRHAPVGRRARRQGRRADVGAQPARGRRAGIAPRQLSGRGVSYWTDGRGDDRVLYVTAGYRLVALNAHTGSMLNEFGKNGIVDLKEGDVFGAGQQISGGNYSGEYLSFSLPGR